MTDTTNRIARLRAERDRIADRIMSDTEGWYTGDRLLDMVRHIDILDRRIAEMEAAR